MWQAATILLAAVSIHGAIACFDVYNLPDVPVSYVDYGRMCGLPEKCYGVNTCPNPKLFATYENEAYLKAVAELSENEQHSKDPLYLIAKNEYDYRLFFTKHIPPEEQFSVRRSLNTVKFQRLLAKHICPCEMRNLLEAKCPANLTLPCGDQRYIKCDPQYRYRSYDGSCNNLQHAKWGMRGNALKREIAPCYDDYISKPMRSSSGKHLPQNRKLVVSVKRALEATGKRQSTSLSMFMVFFGELVTVDMIGRAHKRVKHETGGFRGCRADGGDKSFYISRLTDPLRVQSDDPHYGPRGIRCLNFSPQEKSNVNCKIRYSSEPNLETPFLDLSVLYGHGEYKNGRLETDICYTSKHAVKISSLKTVMLQAVEGLFVRLHNYCVDQISACRKCPTVDKESVEKCRTWTIAIYQKLIYKQLLPTLFGDAFYEQCNFDCKYNACQEPAVSLTYKNSIGRFQHTWIPECMTYPENGKDRSIPINAFFRNKENFDCSAVLSSSLRTPVQESRFSDAATNRFVTKDNQTGHCLHCMDLARGRDAGLCPLLTFKHYLEKRIGDSDSSKCYKTFDDLGDLFSPELIELFKKQYEKPADIDMMFGIFDQRGYPGGNLPQIVAQATCLEFKRLKCTDRFFYTWNPTLSEEARQLVEAFDFTVLLSLFTDLSEVPTDPFFVDSAVISTLQVRNYVKKLSNLFLKF